MIEFILCVLIGGWVIGLACGLIGDLFGWKQRRRYGDHWAEITRRSIANDQARWRRRGMKP